MKKFETSLAVNARWSGGYAGGPGVDLDRWADEVFGGKVPGPWLCCYMLRRFGWPNAGSDDHKNLVSWDLTTPIKGLWLCVTPYLGGSNLHFSILYNKVVGDKITRFHIQVRAAIKAVMRDLMRPTSVRDISFTPFGDIERTPEAIAHYSNQPSAPRWDGAGYTPEYYFTHRRQIRREQRKENRNP